MRLSFNKRHVELWERFDSGPDLFLGISFKDACFDGEAIFSGRVFEEIVDFTNACFYFPPTFSSVTNSVWVDLTGVHFDFVPTETLRASTTTSEIPLRLRAFRKVAEETKNHDLERDLYIAEREAELGVHWRHLAEKLKGAPVTDKPRILGRILSHALWIGVMFGYLVLADYGRSFLRPAVLLGLSVPVFHWGYTKVLAPLMPQAGTLDAANYARAVWILALGNAVPFVGPLTIDSEIKKFLLCPSNNCSGPIIPPEGYQLLVLGQNLVSITLVFFIGLALRNYFKIK